MNSDAARAKSSASHMGKPAWNKGNNWRDGKSPEELRAIAATRAARRRANNPTMVMSDRFSALIRHHLKVRKGAKNRTPWPELVGYTAEALEKRLRATIPAGFTWEDYIAGRLHIDHIIPVSAFNFTKPTDPDFRRCWALKNLRLLEKIENLKKGARLLQPFQPTLAL